ncbi:MAG: PAS domain S-box protein [Parvibaculum sp.]|uniref:PAS domain-containing sensor histidine kinase n=1 Tax=Parvibaculum sp. TaxID=2024848 RepID=UPI003C7625B2
MSPGFSLTQSNDESAARLEALLATAVDGIVIIDAMGNVQVYSPACEKLFGYTADEVIGQNVKMLMPAPYREEHDGYLEHYRTTGQKRIIGIGRDVHARRKDGSTFPMYLSVGEGIIAGEQIFVGIIHDITERRSTERHLRDVQAELLHVSRLSAMGQMAAALAHELNQPLSAVMNYVNAARRTIAGIEIPEVVRSLEYLEKASAQTSRAGQIIRRLREFIAKGKSNRASENLNKVVEEAVALSVTGLAESNVKVRTEYQAELPPVLIDKIQIQQVILNLVRNSFEAMKSVERRELTISTLTDEAGSVVVSISDTGPGLTPEVQAQLFQPFTTTKQDGMGIGLSICRSIIESHDGLLWANANTEHGVTFAFRLPMTPETQEAHDA